MKKYLLMALLSVLVVLVGLYLYFARGQDAKLPDIALVGRVPEIATAREAGGQDFPQRR